MALRTVVKALQFTPAVITGGGRVASPAFRGLIEIMTAHTKGGSTIKGDDTHPDGFAVLLHEESATPCGVCRIEAGRYRFDGLNPGKYAVVLVDPAGAYRAKVIHTIAAPEPAPAVVPFVFRFYPQTYLRGLLKKDIPYTSSLQVAHAVGSVSFSKVSGALPAGLSFDPATGGVTGTPTAAGAYAFRMRAETTSGQVAERDFAGAVMAGFLQWRIYISANTDGGAYTGIAEMELRDAAGADLTTPALAASSAMASSEYDATAHAAKNAFDNDTTETTSRWASSSAGTPQWIGWKGSQGLDVTSVAIWPRSSAGQNPKNFLIQQRDFDADAWVTTNTIRGATWVFGTPNIYPAIGVPGPAVWDPDRASINMLTTADNATAYKETGNSSWDGTILGKLGKTTGKHVFELVFVRQMQTLVAFAGVARQTHALNTYLGASGNMGWGYYGAATKYHNGATSAYGTVIAEKDIVTVKVDLDAGTIAYARNGVDQGVAFTGVSGELFPATSSYRVGDRVKLNQRADTMRLAVPAGYTAWDPSTTSPVPETWDPDDSGPMTLSNGNLTATRSGTGASKVRGTKALTRKRYWEVTAAWVGSSSDDGVGIASIDVALTGSSYLGQTTAGCGVWGFVNDVFHNNAVIHNGPSGANHIYRFAFDPDTRKLWIGTVAGGWFTGDPATGAAPMVTMPAGLYFPCYNAYNTSTVTANFGGSAFAGAVPAGFS